MITNNRPKRKRMPSSSSTRWGLAAMLLLVLAGLGAFAIISRPTDDNSITAEAPITGESACITVSRLLGMEAYSSYEQPDQNTNSAGSYTEPMDDRTEADGRVYESGTATAAPTMELGSVSDRERTDEVVVGGTYAEEPSIALPSAPADTTSVMDADSDDTEYEYGAEDGVGGGGEGYAYDESTSLGLRGPGGDTPAYTEVRQQAVDPLRAGEINDNVDWDTYLDYRYSYATTYGMYSVHEIDVTDRQIIRVTDDAGQPINGACVQVHNGDLLISESLTYATGMTLFFPNLRESTRYVDSFNVTVWYNDTYEQTTLDREAVGGVTHVQFDDTFQQVAQLDVVFLLDATGSMGDEIAQLQDNILAISSQVDELNVDVRYGLVAYRDYGDAYIVREYEFTDDVREFQTNINAVQANGGGDYPESLNAGLSTALDEVKWRGADTIKLMFLVADAPPHIDYNERQYDILVQEALARGIKIHSIASSGLQPEGEYILRQISQFTMGNFIFLTYDESGEAGTTGDYRPDLEVGSPEDAQGVGDYDVSQLDELVLRLIEDELANIMGQ